MTKFVQRSFTVHSPGGPKYADNWEQTFGKKEPCPVHPHATGGEIKAIGLGSVEGTPHEVLYERWARDRMGWECNCGRVLDTGFPEAPQDVLDRIAQLHRRGDEAWERGDKVTSDHDHRAASELGEKYGLNPVRCDQCETYMPARDLAQHQADKHR